MVHCQLQPASVWGVSELSGSVARNVSGFWVRYAKTHKPGALVTGDADDEISRGLCGWQEKRLTQKDAGQLLGVSARTFRRQIGRFEADGMQAFLEGTVAVGASR